MRREEPAWQSWLQQLSSPGLIFSNHEGGTPWSDSTDRSVLAGPAAGHTGRTPRLRGLVGVGLVATLAAAAATALAAALAQALGVVFEVPDGGPTIPLSGFAVVTGFFSLIGVGLALALVRWSLVPPSDSSGPR